MQLDDKLIVISNFGTAGTIIVDEFLEKLGSLLSDFVEKTLPDYSIPSKPKPTEDN